MQTIRMTERLEKKKTNIKKSIKLAFILFLLIFLPYMYISNMKTLNILIFTRQVKVVYNTFSVSFEKDIPTEYVDLVKEKLGSIAFNEKRRFEFVEGKSDIVVSSTPSEGSVDVFKKDLIPVGHVYSLLNEIVEKDVQKYNLYILDSQYIGYVKAQYGVEPKVATSIEELITTLKKSDSNIGLVEFKDLSSSFKILRVDSHYYLDDNEGSIPIRFYATLDNQDDAFILAVMKKNLSDYGDDWSKENLAKINMSGVVAISRGLAYKMDSLKNYDYPAEKLGSFLADADLTHISNEGSFTDTCKVYSGMRFCSNTKYFETLTASGVDIVELTGNHNNDFGSVNNAKSIQMYKDAGMRYFGGGLNKDDASKILYEEVKGTKIAFLGYNYYDSMLKTGAIAWGSTAGANSYTEAKMKADIEEARKNADIVIVDFQFQECYSYPSSDVVYPICYKPLSSPDQKGTFRKAIDFGADIVIGTQAHQPQTYELYGNGVIYYGLGNLYFDQKYWIGTRQGIVLTHYFYKGKHIQTKLTPIYMDSSLQPELATKTESEQLLKSLKNARN